MNTPSIKEVAAELRLINSNVECDEEGCDVRLQVYENGDWAIRSGASDYDQDHRGYWGCSGVPGIQGGAVKRFNSIDIARDLIEQVKEAKAGWTL